MAGEYRQRVQQRQQYRRVLECNHGNFKHYGCHCCDEQLPVPLCGIGHVHAIRHIQRCNAHCQHAAICEQSSILRDSMCGQQYIILCYSNGNLYHLSMAGEYGKRLLQHQQYRCVQYSHNGHAQYHGCHYRHEWLSLSLRSFGNLHTCSDFKCSNT
jgi:hypothetical protein